MRPLLLLVLLGYAALASGQLAKCQMPSGRMVWRGASDCPRGRVRETVRIGTPPPAAPAVSASQYDAMRGAPPAPIAGPAPNQGETPAQYMARWEVYCVSLPPAQRADCRVQAQAQTQLYSANYQAAFDAESLRRTQETVRKIR